MPTIVIQMMRDKRLADLNTDLEIQRASEGNAVRQKSVYDRKKKEYLEWCKENDVDPMIT